MAGGTQVREDEYRDCPFEMFGRDAINELKTDVKTVQMHVQGMEISRAEDSQKLISVVASNVRIEKSVDDVKRMVQELQTTEPPVDTFRAVIYDLGIWILKIAALGGVMLFIGEKVLN